MGSGMFPVNTDGIRGQKIIEIKESIRKFRDEVAELVYSGDSGGGQFDNAAEDGGYLERLNVAIEMLDALTR